MELAARADVAPHPLRTIWLWAPVLGIGLAAALAGHLPPGGAGEVARAAGHRLLDGDFGLGWGELAALAFTAGWLVAKPLCVIGAILWLELRFGPGARPKDYLLGWAMQALALALFAAAMALVSLFGLFPQPLLEVGETRGLVPLLLISVPTFILTLMVYDFFGYWWHRAMHRIPLLWRFHRIHHSLDVDVLHSFGHPVDQFLGILFIGLPTAFLIGVSQEQLYLIVAFTSLQGYLNHSRLPIHLGPLGGTLLSDNRYHFIHHSRDPAHHDRNFADRFPVFDMLFGTYVPRGETLAETGLAEEAPPGTLGQYLTAGLAART